MTTRRPILLLVVLGAAGLACALPGCGPSPVAQGSVELEPDVVRFCCDPEGDFPQVAGTVTITNGDPSHDVGAIMFPGDTATMRVEAGSSLDFPIRVDACGDQTTTIRVATEPETDFAVRIEDRCPGVVVDPTDPAIGDPSVDLTECRSAVDDTVGTWVACDVAGDWPPSDSLWSWYVTVSLLAEDGSELVRCTTQRHDGTPSTFCDVGEATRLGVVATASGPVFSYDTGGAAAATFRVETGTAPASGDPITNDEVEGPVGDEGIAPPG